MWDYYVHNTSLGLGPDKLDSWLNQLGDKGWELVQVVNTTWIFKRPRNSPIGPTPIVPSLLSETDSHVG